MTTSRTGTTKWLRIRARVVADARASGLTHCPLCGVELDYEHAKQPNSAEVDHIVPVAQGGSDEPSNLRVICKLDNGKRGDGRRPEPAASGDFPVDAAWLDAVLASTPARHASSRRTASVG